MGFGTVMWGFLVFLGWGSLYKHKRITLGKKLCLCDTVIIADNYTKLDRFGFFKMSITVTFNMDCINLLACKTYKQSFRFQSR